jgi:cell division protein FtsB
MTAGVETPAVFYSVAMNKTLKIISNKYFITGLSFLVWCAFFDQNDWISLSKKQDELNALRGSTAFLNSEIARMEAEKHALLNDKQKIEEYARENNHLKKANEDVYVIEEKKP